MKTQQEIKSKLSQHKADLARRYKIKQLGIFGSYSRGDFTEGSDVDILVEFTEPVGLEVVDLADELESLLEQKIDLVSKGAIKPRYWKHVEPEVVYV